MEKVLIIGACSAIAQETAKLFAKDGAALYLADLKKGRLESVKSDILTRYETKIFIEEFDALNFDKHQELIENASKALNGIDIVLIAYGTLPDQTSIQKDYPAILREFNINCVSVISLSSIVANYFEEKQKGTLAVISSVAGDRGRQSNYIYGAAKGGVSVFLQGLRNRMFHSNVNIITIKPGLVDTPMTAHLPKNFLFASAESVGRGIYEAIKLKKDVVYLPWFWKFIMCIVKAIPESLFKKMKL
ncbi:MAG: SDR family oxidoreductase [Candidatus Kapabacteria bacterium]|nr:SDR family oxidoreductase [Candidatus Kapabacteria bacterium]